MATGNGGLVIVGAGHAGSELAVAARQNGWQGAITLLGDESRPPYQRPPLSKAYLLGKMEAAELQLRPESAYAAAAVDWRPGSRVVALDRGERALTLADGTELRYEKLAWCAGGRPRPLVCAGLDPQRPPANLFYLRTAADSDAIRAALHAGARLVVVGGGYVGLEVAASARELGADVTLLEAQPRLLARVAGEPVAAFYASVHRAAGVQVLTGMEVAAIETDGEAVSAVVCRDGARLQADLVVVGIGMLPNIEALQAAGLADRDGVAVDENSCTADPDIVAAGDCTTQRHPLYDRQVRIESVPNALEQARAAAAWLCGKCKPNRQLPWFWSDQYDLKLQMAGLSAGFDRCVLRGEPAARSFCAFYLHGRRLLAMEAVNRPADFMLARRMLARPIDADSQFLADESIPLKEILNPAA